MLYILKRQLSRGGQVKATSTFGLCRGGARSRRLSINGKSDLGLGELYVEISATSDDISKTEREISGVEREIKKVTDLLEEMSLTGSVFASTGGDQENLRNKEHLRKEKDHLRTTVNILLKHQYEPRKSISADEISTSSLLTTPAQQSNASSYSKSSAFIFGFGHLPTSYRLDPTKDQRIAKLLLPSPADVSAAHLLVPMGELGTLAPRMEHATEGVREILQGFADERMPDVTQTGSALSTLGLSQIGVVTSTSMSNFVWRKSGRVMGILEVKGGEASSLVALRQAAVTGTTVAMDLLRVGRLRPEQIVVPVVGTNGTSAQFGSIIVLEPSFPTFVPVSGVLDLADVEGNKQAAAYFAKASECAQIVHASLGGVKNVDDRKKKNSEELEMVLDKDKYWIKELTEDKYSLGIGLFSSSKVSHRLDVGLGLEHMGRALTLLYRDEKTRGIPVFPLSVRSPHTATDNYLIVYENLATQGFRIGTPNRLADEQQYQRYLSALRSAVEAIHAAGVVHTDLYPSNIMWREQVEEKDGGNGKMVMVIRIIDWDCSHCLAEGSFNEAISQTLRSHKPTRTAVLGVEHDLRYLRILEAPRGHEAWEDGCWEALASNDVNRINGAFYKLFPLT